MKKLIENNSILSLVALLVVKALVDFREQTCGVMAAAVEEWNAKPETSMRPPSLQVSNKRLFLSSTTTTTTTNSSSQRGRQENDTEYMARVRKALELYIKNNRLGLNPSRLLAHNGTAYVVFDCKTPSYLDPSRTKVRLDKSSELMRNRHDGGLKSRLNVSNTHRVQCDLPTNLWREDAGAATAAAAAVASRNSRLLVYNPKSRRFSLAFNENHLKYILRLDKTRELRSRMLNESLIVAVLKVYHHPRFFY